MLGRNSLRPSYGVIFQGGRNELRPYEGKIMNHIRVVCTILFLATASSVLAESNMVSLPKPKTDSMFSVEKALHQRRSLRNPQEAPLTLAQIGQLCWAAQGVTGEKGHRTAPSAMAAYPLELYVIAGSVKGFAPGLYHYEPATHSLHLLSAGDKRNEFMVKASGQAWIAKAPAIFVISGAVKKMAKMKDRKEQFMATEAGLAAQGFFLQAESLGLGSTFVGGFNPANARKTLGLKYDEEVLAVLPVGKKP